MSEEQREMTEEELRDGIPVDPSEEETDSDADEDVADVEVDEPRVESPEESTAISVLPEAPQPIERPVMTLLPDNLVRWGYIVIVPFGGKRQPILTVDGIRHVAQTMGIRLLNCDVRADADGEWLYGEAEAHDPHTGATWYGKVRQNTRHKSGKGRSTGVGEVRHACAT